MAKTLYGTVTADSADKTIVVTVQTRKTHPIYKKQYMVSKRFMAHDEKNEARLGDKVTIAETRPLSARKRHILEKVVERPIITKEAVASVGNDEAIAALAKAEKAEKAEVEAAEAKTAKKTKEKK